ncbi:MAG: 16S rRNA (cytidine(1402)-2'-O)-methyltransferase [Xanthomonadales bacterium]|nr:16S rRNA (cytidine(1402)-2'-O)-methyltransferase [Xanthomonadales bacterium]
MNNDKPIAELFVVATPIGNLDDMTYRAVNILSNVSVVAAEDTRHTRVLFDHFGIKTPLVILHEHNESAVGPQLVKRLCAGESVALVSDAGTPLLSDPGYRLLNLAIAANVTIKAIPGPSAITAALSIAGLATDRFVFEGFLPARQAARTTCLERLRFESRTLVFFESSHRVLASVKDIAQVFGAQRLAVICRELTKRFETTLRGELGHLQQVLGADPMQQKGEFVILLAGVEPDQDEQMPRAIEMGHALQEYLSGSQAARVAARLYGVDRRELYQKLSGLEQPLTAEEYPDKESPAKQGPGEA